MAVPTGIEPAISCVTGRHVNRYTTGPKVLPSNVLLSQDLRPTTIDAKELNYCVRYGNRCDLFAIATRQIIRSKLDKRTLKSWLSPRPISIRQLHMSPYFHAEPIYLIVFEGSYLLA